MLVSYNTTAQDSIKKDKIKIIVGSFKYEWNATALYSLLKSKGYKEVNVLPKINGFHRVSIKAFFTKKEADLFIIENNLIEKDYWYIFPKKRNVPLVSVKKEVDFISKKEIKNNLLNKGEDIKKSDLTPPSSTLSPSLIDTYSPSESEESAATNVPLSDVVSVLSSLTGTSNEADIVPEDAAVTQGVTTDTPTATTLEDSVPTESTKITSDTSSNSNATGTSNEANIVPEDAEITEGVTTDTPTATTLEDSVPIESTKITSDTSSNSNAAAKQFFDVSLGFASTDFTYVDSSGNSDVKFIPGNKNFLSLNYSFQIRKNFFLRTGVDLFSFGTTSQDISNGNTYKWETSYIGIGTGIDWKIFSVKKISLKVQSRIGFANITSGTQKINLTTFDITDNSEFNGNHLYYSLGFALNFKLSKNIIIGINASKLIYTNVGLTEFPKPDIESLKQGAENFGFSVIFPINKEL